VYQTTKIQHQAEDCGKQLEEKRRLSKVFKIMISRGADSFFKTKGAQK
jgi:hypothetical protein